MPHLTLQYSETIAETHDLQALCDALHDALADHPDVPRPESLKIRALPCPYWRMGSGPQSFAHGDLTLLKGRDLATKSRLSEAVLAVLVQHLPDVGSLSVDVDELDDAYARRVLTKGSDNG